MGSRLLPYSWFLALEVQGAGSQALFRESLNLERFGLIPAPASSRNPDALAIGLVKDPVGEPSIGVTCAACHTGSLSIAGQRVIIEGGASMFDFGAFLHEIIAALKASEAPGPKFDRFAKRVGATDPSALRHSMQAKIGGIEGFRADIRRPGPGRLDAFGLMFNRMLGHGLGVASNSPPLSAPVRYPFLWDTAQLDYTGSNGTWPGAKLAGEAGPLARDMAQAAGFFSDFKVESGFSVFGLFQQPPRVTSSVNVSNVRRLEAMLPSLSSPVWPSECLPLADSRTLARGAVIYEEQCSGCHRVLKNPERRQETRQIRSILMALGEVLTDPAAATNDSTRRAKTGLLEGTLNPLTQTKFGPEASARELLIALLTRAGLPARPADLKAFQKAIELNHTPHYKARPLDGIWATAPYLHNGSVPSLADLLNLPEKRPATFLTGSGEFDASHIGLYSDRATGFHFDTSKPGNSNSGHTFGHHIKPHEKKDLIEYLKTL